MINFVEQWVFCGTQNTVTEVPLTTTGGYMKADIMLVKRNVDGVIEDVIIIENKLSAGTAFTERQKEGFGAILNGPIKTPMTVKYLVNLQDASKNVIKPGYFKADDIINASKSKIFKFSDSGTDDIGNVTISLITRTN